MSATIPIRRPILTHLTFLRLWGAGGLSGATMWLEVLAASLFTYEVTHSGWAVAVVSAARAAPLLVFGALAGIVSDAWNRRSVVLGGLFLSALAAGGVTVLGLLGMAHPWHLVIAAFVSGSAYATELPARRRLVTDSVEPGTVDRAIALDSLTGYAARCGGPVIGGLLFQHLGLPGPFAISCLGNLAAMLLVAGVTHAQVMRPLVIRSLVPEFRAVMAYAARSPVLMRLLAITVIMNLCGYSYTTLVAPIGLQVLGLDGTWTGVLAAAEPGGALLGGLCLTRLVLPGSRLSWLIGGVAILAAGLLAAAAFASQQAGLAAICFALAAGGCGSAFYTLSQTSLVFAETPPEIRSRVFGLVTICIGSWPLGLLLAGGLARALSPLAALVALAVCCLALLTVAAVVRVGRRGVGE